MMFRKIFLVFFVLILGLLLPFLSYGQNSKDEDYTNLSIGYYTDINVDDISYLSLNFGVNSYLTNYYNIDFKINFMYSLNDSSDFNYLFNLTPTLQLFSGKINTFHIYFDIGTGLSISENKTMGLNGLLNIGLGYENFSIYLSNQYINLKNSSLSLFGINLKYSF